MRRLKKIGKTVLIIYALLTVMIYFFQEKLIFLPTKLAPDFSYSFAQPHKEFFLTAADGAQLNAIHFKQNNPKGVILYFHGNAGDLSRWGTITEFFVEKHYDVIVMDYRTYGKSTGAISETALHEDAQLFYDYTLKQYTEDAIIIYGRSLGTGIASRLASKNKPYKLILETPFFNLMDVAQDRFPFLPLKWLLKYQFASHEYVQDVGCPIFIFHGTEDGVISYDSGKRLFTSLEKQEKKMYTIEGGGHNNLVTFEVYQKGIDEALEVNELK